MTKKELIDAIKDVPSTAKVGIAYIIWGEVDASDPMRSGFQYVDKECVKEFMSVNTPNVNSEIDIQTLIKTEQ